MRHMVSDKRFASDRHRPDGKWVQATTTQEVSGVHHRKTEAKAFADAARKAEKKASSMAFSLNINRTIRTTVMQLRSMEYPKKKDFSPLAWPNGTLVIWIENSRPNWSAISSRKIFQSLRSYILSMKVIAASWISTSSL
jgi:hypothetical protein